ncbi:MAG: fumarate hydratase C-terminal domain-containing protein [Candidatus Aureabacteria bacterium]|nr:fumarate hydratase C-terminal domain-containing protein [Candidatus Auribacterota bacterium]
MNKKVFNIKTPLAESVIKKLRSGNIVYLSGTIYTARDQAHRIIMEMIQEKKKLPFEMKGQVIYYCGPTSARSKGHAGSCGPTTSSRMDKYTIKLLSLGLKGMIGKGERSSEIVDAIKEKRAVYFAAPAGLGALVNRHIIKSECIAFKKLGPEAVYKFEVKDMPLIVVNDVKGNDVYKRKRKCLR